MNRAQKLEAFPRIEKERDRLDLMLHDVMNDGVVYGEWVKETDGPGKYRVGISDRGWPIAMLVWRVKGQRDSIQVHDAEPWEQELYRLRMSSEVWEPVISAFVSAKAALTMKREGIAA